MSGIVGIASKKDCAEDLFYCTDYHSHLGTKYGGLAVFNGKVIEREIHNISENQFRPQFSNWIRDLKGKTGIGVISDYEPQPLIIDSHLGTFSIVHVGAVQNLEQLVEEAHRRRSAHFTEMGGSKVNPTELIATLINQGDNFVDGIEIMQNKIKGSSSVMLLNGDGIYVARDRYGRTPLVIGKRGNARAVVSESCALPNTGFEIERYLGPGEIGIVTADGYEQLKKPGEEMQICSFLWIYYGYPASDYEGINVEAARYRCGAIHGQKDLEENLEVDFVAGIPDSGTAHAIGYANVTGFPYKRPFVKYSPTWQRSFMPQEQKTREMIGKMKLILNEEIVNGKRIVFCEDSIVRGTQLQGTIQRLFDAGAKEVYMRPACPPLTYACKFLNFSRSKSEFDLAARKAVRDLLGREDFDMAPYLEEGSKEYEEMVNQIRKNLGLTGLRYQKLCDMVKAIGLPREKLCTYCWTGQDITLSK